MGSVVVSVVTVQTDYQDGVEYRGYAVVFHESPFSDRNWRQGIVGPVPGRQLFYEVYTPERRRSALP